MLNSATLRCAARQRAFREVFVYNAEILQVAENEPIRSNLQRHHISASYLPTLNDDASLGRENTSEHFHRHAMQCAC